MSKTLAMGPNGTAVEGLATLTFPIAPLNYDADFVASEDVPGKYVIVDVTSPQDQPATIRIAQSVKSNVYSGSSIDPAAYLPNKKGLDTIFEVREVWSITDSTDTTFLQQAPVRAALTLSLPTSALITEVQVKALIARVLAAVFDQGAATADTGIDRILHGVVRKG